MPDRHSPTLRRRRLSAEIRRLRDEAGLSSVEVTKRLDWSSGKLTRFERGEWKRPNPRDVQDLCDVYGVTDARRREYLIQLARDGRLKGWWDPYHSMLSEAYSTYIGLEAEAATVFNFEPLMIPGLLQTEAYARALGRGNAREIEPSEIDKRIEIRMERQAALRTADALRLWAVIDEAAVRRSVGGPEVMRDQMDAIVQAAELAKVTVQVIPYGVGAHASMTGGFAIIGFREPEDPDAVYVETPAGELFVEDAEEVDRFHVASQHLQSNALSPSDSLAFIRTEIRP